MITFLTRGNTICFVPHLVLEGGYKKTNLKVGDL
jgi:hypothetical protein